MKTLALLMLCLGVSCATPIAGTKCDSGVAYCSSPSASLTCQNGTLVPYACPGPKGCSLGSNRAVLCDQSAGVVAATPCFPEYAGRGECSADGSSLLTCVNGQWAQASCGPGLTCKDVDGGAGCR